MRTVNVSISKVTQVISRLCLPLCHDQHRNMKLERVIHSMSSSRSLCPIFHSSTYIGFLYIRYSPTEQSCCTSEDLKASHIEYIVYESLKILLDVGERLLLVVYLSRFCARYGLDKGFFPLMKRLSLIHI